MADHRESGQHGRMKLLVEQPVADDMLDVVAHRRKQVNQQIAPIVAVAQRRESDFVLGSRRTVPS
jgi:hypothetical protein